MVFKIQNNMKLYNKKLLALVFSLIFISSVCQTKKNDSLRGEFTYMMQYKINKLSPDYIIKELFSLQITDNKAFFSSVNRLKRDSAFNTQLIGGHNDNILDSRNIPQTRASFLIIQTNTDVQYYGSVSTTLLSYNSPVINNWKLINETKIINSIDCKKAEVKYKGRDWIAWYAPEIPFPFGPYKFSGLPGLIIKITDKTGDYDFELVQSKSNTQLQGKTLVINKGRYENAKLVTKKEFLEARKNFRKNFKFELESAGIILSDSNQNTRIDETEKPGYNPLELEE